MNKKQKFGWITFYVLLVVVISVWCYRIDLFPMNYGNSKYNGDFPVPNHAVWVKGEKKRNFEKYEWGPDLMDNYGLPSRYKLAITRAGWKKIKLKGDIEEIPTYEKNGHIVSVEGFTEGKHNFIYLDGNLEESFQQ